MKLDFRIQCYPLVATAFCALSLFNLSVAAAETPSVLKDGKIGYVMYHENRAIYEPADLKAQCPNGFNIGMREQFDALYPDGKSRSVVDTQMARVSQVWFPDTSTEPYPFYEAQGKIGLGLNLDGKIGPNDYTSPDNVPGIDNELYRVLGCVRNYRKEGNTSFITQVWRPRFAYNIFVIELSGVDSLSNDDDVTVTTYRGTHPLITNATGASFTAGGTQTVDTRWGKKFIQTFRGKISNGVLTTEAKDYSMPLGSHLQPRDGIADILYRDMRFSLKLTPTDAEGYIGAYVDVDSWITQSAKTRAEPLQAFGNSSLPSLYKAMRRLADAHPDPKDGHNTAISAALDVKFKQAFVRHLEPAAPTDANTSTIAALERQ